MVLATSTDKRGMKRICMNCSTRFYDFNKRPIVCPNCDTEFTGEIKVKARRARIANDTEEDLVIAKLPDDDLDEADIATPAGDDDDEEVLEDDTVSLDDVDEDSDDTDEEDETLDADLDLDEEDLDDDDLDDDEEDDDDDLEEEDE